MAAEESKRLPQERDAAAPKSPAGTGEAAHKPGRLKTAIGYIIAAVAGVVVVRKRLREDTEESHDAPRPSQLGIQGAVPAGLAGPATGAGDDCTTSDETAPKHPDHAGFATYIKELAGRFGRDDAMTRAQALAFTCVLSIIPILLFALAAIGFFVTPADSMDAVHTLVAHILPGEQAAKAANAVIAQTGIATAAQGLVRARGWALCVGTISLVWTGIGLFMSMIDPLNAAWEVRESREFVRLRFIALGVFLACAVLFVLSLAPSSGPSFVTNLHIAGIGLPKHPPLVLAIVIQVVFELIAWVIDIALFVIIYKALPATLVSWRSALFGGAIAGLLWEVFKKAFAVYLAHFGSYNKLYGTLGSLVLLVTWILYSCALLIAGAILCKMYHEYTQGGVRKCTPKPTR